MSSKDPNTPEHSSGENAAMNSYIFSGLFILIIVAVAFFQVKKRDHLIQAKNEEINRLKEQIRMSEAQTQARKTLQANESHKNAEFLFLEAKLAIRQQSPKSEIIEKIDTAFQSSDKGLKASIAAAELYKMAGMTSIFKKTLKSALNKAPNNLEILYLLHCQTIIELKTPPKGFQLTKWFQLIKKRIQGQDANEYHSLLKAWSLIQEKNYHEALPVLKSAEQFNSQLRDIYFLRCLSKQKLGQWQSALKDCNKGLSLNRTDAAFFRARAECWLALKQFSKAIQDYQAYLKLKAKAQDSSQLKQELKNLKSQ